MTLTLSASQAADTKQTVTQGKNVSLEYTLTLDDKSVVESNVGKQPLTYTHGTRQIIPGLEKALEGLAVGDTKEVTVAQPTGMARRIPTRCKKRRRSCFLPMRSSLGRSCKAAPDGNLVYPRVAEIKDDTVVLDFNHPWRAKRYISMSRSSIFNRSSPGRRACPEEELRAPIWTTSRNCSSCSWSSGTAA